MPSTRLTAFALAATLSGCIDGETYDPPPDLASTNVVAGLFDEDEGAVRIVLTEPVVKESLRVTLYLARWSTERELCLPNDEGAFAGGCSPDDPALPLDAEVVYSTEGVVEVTPLVDLIAYEPYLVVIAEGLEDAEGRQRAVPIEVPFQVGCVFPEVSPTTFESGRIFGMLEVFSPIPTKIYLFMWFEVDGETGRIHIFGADGDPINPEEVTESQTVDYNPSNWRVDANLPEGFSFEADGKIAETEGCQAVQFFPFDLVVTKPPVRIEGATYRGTIEEKVLPLPGAPEDARETLSGQLDAPAVFFGPGPDAPDLGGGIASLTLFRLADDEGPPLSDILKEGMSEDYVHNYFATPEE
jgi:hypothetical protein